MGSAPPSPCYGQRLLPVEVDKIARDNPGRVLYYTPRNNQPSQGYEAVTTSRFANAVNRVCWWLESEVGTHTTPKTIGYLGQNDLRYFLLIVAATKVGHKVLLSSPRNSVEGHLSLIRQSGCELWITSPGVGKLSFVNELQLPCIQVPALTEIMDPSAVKPYIYKKQWQEGRSDILALLHTTGSTGLPRLITLTLEAVGTGDALHLVEPIQGKMPSLVAGLCFGLPCAIFLGWSIVLPSTGPVMQHVIEETLDNIDIDSAFVSPVVLSDIAKTPRVLDKLKKLKFVTSAGGPTPPSVGNIIHSRVRFWQTMGMTEGLVVPSVITHPDEWAYFHFHPCCGFEMRRYSDILFELVFVKKKELAATQAIFLTFPDLDIYETRDLYSRHPTVPELYKYETRKDDLVILSNGEKFNPLAAEMKLAGHPWISAVYIAGRGRFQVGALLSPEENRRDASDLAIIEAVWPAIKSVNQHLPAFAQIHRNLVQIVRTPFPRTPKGTLARYEMEKAFSKEIAALYQNSAVPESQSSLPTDSLDIDGSSIESISAGLRKAIQVVSPGLELEQIRDEDNLLENGLDSLHIIRLSRLLNSVFLSSSIRTNPGTIYSHPSVAQLGQVLWTQLHDVHQANQETQTAQLLRTRAVSQTLAKYLSSFAVSREEPKEYVVLTGTTGAVGSYLLDAICKNDKVAKVWCLNRSSTADAACRQAELAHSRGLSSDWKGKVRFVQMDLTCEALGLNQPDLVEIRNQATIMIHNAWEVNFNLPLSSFETQLIGLQSLVRICTKTRHMIRFFFVSSISGAMNWPSHVLGPVPEAKLTNLDASINGYSASKLVAEHLLSKAAKSGVLHLSVLRVGQVAGPITTHGEGSIWSRRDWVPAIIDASAYLRKLPADLGSATALDWIPIDLLAEIMGQLIHSHTKKTGDSDEDELYYNLVNPQTSSWDSLLPTIKARLEAAMAPEKIQVVPFSQWLDDLQAAEEVIVQGAHKHDKASLQTTTSRAQTGFKLLSFFRMLKESSASDDVTASAASSAPNCVVKNALRRSSIFAHLAPVSSAWFETWLSQWGY